MPYATSNLYDTLCGGAVESMKGGRGSNVSIAQLIIDKKTFLVKIFATLVAQLSLTYYIMTHYERKNDVGRRVPNKWVVMLLSLGIIVVTAIAPMSIYFKFGLFTAFSALTGFLFSDLMVMTNPTAVKVAVLGTLGIFATFFMVGAFLLASGIALGFRTGVVLLISLLLLIVAMFVSIFLRGYSTFSQSLTGIGLFLFSMYILYDTNRILQKDYLGDFVTASLDYYLDIINIFIRLLSFNRQ